MNTLITPASGNISFSRFAAGSDYLPPLSSSARIAYTNDGRLTIISTSSAAERFSVEGNFGNLLSVNDTVSGILFSVNDVSGFNLLAVDADGNVTTVGQITALSGNSIQWTASYNIVASNSGNWNSVYTTVSANSANYILDGGNTKGSSLLIGTNDNFNLNFETNGIPRLIISNLGDISGNNPTTSFNQGSATGNISFAIGSARAFGQRSFAQGNNTRAWGSNSYAEGSNTSAGGTSTHAEGTNTQAIGTNAHAEGSGTIADGQQSHAEGTNTRSIGIASHTEGQGTEASGARSHAEGTDSRSTGTNSHAEGSITVASGTQSHTEGTGVSATNTNSHAEGRDTLASGTQSHAEGLRTYATGGNSHAEGRDVFAIGDGSHAEGNNTKAIGINAHVEGSDNRAIGNYSHAAGLSAVAVFDNSWVWHGNSTAFYQISSTRSGQFFVSAGGGVYLAGNVGINTDSIENALSISGRLSTNSIIFASGGNSNQWNSVYSTVSANSANYILDGGNARGANLLIGTNDNFNLTLETNNTDRIIILNSGNVGVSNTTPNERLTVSGNVSANGCYIGQSNVGAGGCLIMSGGSSINPSLPNLFSGRSGTINTSASGFNPGGNILTCGGQGEGAIGGCIVTSGGSGGYSCGGFIDTRGGSFAGGTISTGSNSSGGSICTVGGYGTNAFGGSIITAGSNARGGTINTSASNARGGDIITSGGGGTFCGGNILTCAGASGCGGSISTAGGYGNGGCIDTSAGGQVGVININGGCIITKGGLCANSGSIITSGGTEPNSPGGCIITCGGIGGSSGWPGGYNGGCILTFGTAFGRGGNIDTSAGSSAGANGGCILLKGNLGSAGCINLSGSTSSSGLGGCIIMNGVGTSGGNIIMVGSSAIPGSLITCGTLPGSSGGSIITCGGTDINSPGGSICTSGGFRASGGNIITSGGTGNGSGGGNICTIGGYWNSPGGNVITCGGSGANGSPGGCINTSGGIVDDTPGGSILTCNGGGSINTTGTGSIELGIAATRTTINGSATTSRTITFPDKTGTVMLVSDISSVSGNWDSVYTTVSANSANYILDGGNTKGSSLLIGTNDAFNLTLETNNASRISILSSGEVTLNPITTTPRPSSIQNLFNVRGTAVVYSDVSVLSGLSALSGASPGQFSAGGMLIGQNEGGAYLGRTGIRENSWQVSLSTVGTNWVNKTPFSQTYYAFAMSSDGRVIVTLAGDRVFTSLDYGATWRGTLIMTGTNYPAGVAMSTDGKIVYVTQYGLHIWSSYDYGQTWTIRNIVNTGVTGIATTSDGKIVTVISFDSDGAGSTPGNILISYDFGVTWIGTGPANQYFWQSVAMSSDGKIQIAAPYYNDAFDTSPLHMSYDYGVTWTPIIQTITTNNWSKVAMSSDGRIVAATPDGDRIIVSYDYGNTWKQVENIRSWFDLSMSSDGRILAATVQTGAVGGYVSLDYGNTWRRTTFPPIAASCYGIGMNSDGRIMAIGASNELYVSNAVTVAPNSITVLGTISATSVIYASGGNSTQWSPSYMLVSGNFRSQPGMKYLVDTRTRAVSSSVPVSPAIGTVITYMDAYETWDTNNFILDFIDPIETFSESLSANVRGVTIALTYVGSTIGWRVQTQAT